MRVLEEDKNDKYNFNIDSVYFFVLLLSSSDFKRKLIMQNWMGGRLRFVYSNKLCTRIDLMRETAIATTAASKKKNQAK